MDVQITDSFTKSLKRLMWHESKAYGYSVIPYKDKWGDIYTFNGCSCNLRYEVDNKPITFDYDFITRELEFIHE